MGDGIAQRKRSGYLLSRPGSYPRIAGRTQICLREPAGLIFVRLSAHLKIPIANLMGFCKFFYTGRLANFLKSIRTGNGLAEKSDNKVGAKVERFSPGQAHGQLDMKTFWNWLLLQFCSNSNNNNRNGKGSATISYFLWSN